MIVYLKDKKIRRDKNKVIKGREMEIYWRGCHC